MTATGTDTIETFTFLVDGKLEEFYIDKSLNAPNLVFRSSDKKPFALKLSVKGRAQEANEYLAFQLYDAAGCGVPKTYWVQDTKTKQYGLLQEFEEFDKMATLRDLMAKPNPKMMSMLTTHTLPVVRRDFVIHALFANWDIRVMGNIVLLRTGKGPYDYDFAHPVLINSGGSLKYGIFGQIKPYTNKMKNIESSIACLESQNKMDELKGGDQALLKSDICARWSAVNQNAILSAFKAAAPKVKPFFTKAGINLNDVKTALEGRMAYLNNYCGLAAVRRGKHNSNKTRKGYRALQRHKTHKQGRK